jgi:hypothetical protein
LPRFGGLDSVVEAGDHRDGADDLVADPEVGADHELVPRFGRARMQATADSARSMSAQSSVQRCLPLLAAQAREARPGNLREVHDRLTHPRLLVEAAPTFAPGRFTPNRVAVARSAPTTFQWRSTTSAGYGSCAPSSRSMAFLNGCSVPASRAVSWYAAGRPADLIQRSAREAGRAGAAPAAGLRRPAGARRPHPLRRTRHAVAVQAPCQQHGVIAPTSPPTVRTSHSHERRGPDNRIASASGTIFISRQATAAHECRWRLPAAKTCVYPIPTRGAIGLLLGSLGKKGCDRIG